MEVTWDLKKDIVKKIREIKPDTVLCMDPTFIYSDKQNYINHNDHIVVGKATFDAVYPLARDETAFDDLVDLEPHKVKNLLLYNLNDESEFVDITNNLEKKIQAAKAHTSQFGDGSKVESIIRDYAKVCGAKANCACAEGYVRLTIDRSY